MLTVVVSGTQPYPLPVPNFDLTNVLATVARKHPDWTLDRLLGAEAKYRAFMADAKANPGTEHFIADTDLDEVWHAHILFTRQYGADCQNYFGYFFHHHPGGAEEPKLERKLTKACCSGGCGQ